MYFRKLIFFTQFSCTFVVGALLVSWLWEPALYGRKSAETQGMWIRISALPLMTKNLRTLVGKS
jgi:hypothetical protein